MEWKEVRLGDVCNIITGFPFPGKKYSKEGIRVVRGDNVTIGNLRWDTEKDKRWNEPFDKTEYYSLQANDIVIGMDGSRVGKNKARIKEEDLPLLLAQRVACVRHNELAEQDYLYYNIFSKKFIDYVNSIHTGSAIPHISQKQIEDYKILLPDLETQRRIASILSSLDRKIELNNKINADLEEMAQAIFKNWFVDFEPFKDGKFVDSELGMIPEGWKVGTLDEIADITMGQSPAGNSLNEKGEGMIFYQGSSDFGFRFPSIRVFTTEPKRLAVVNSVLFSVRAPVGDINVTKEECCIGRGVASIKSKYGHDSYLFYTMKSLHKLFDSFDGEGTVFGSINKKTLSAIQILLPSDGIVEQFNDIASSFDNRIRSLSDENSRLSLLRDTLLPRLMSGEIEVPE